MHSLLVAKKSFLSTCPLAQPHQWLQLSGNHCSGTQTYEMFVLSFPAKVNIILQITFEIIPFSNQTAHSH